MNADAVLADDELGLYAVADGVGSSPESVRASRTAIEEARQVYRDQLDAGAVDLERLIDAAYAGYLKRLSDLPDKPSTTLTVLTLREGTLQYVSVGDSPIFLLDHDRVALITRHHTMVDQSRILSNFSELKSLEGSNILVNTFGDSPPRAVTYEPIVAPAPCRLVMCTDGLMDFLLQTELGRLNGQSRSSEALLRRLHAAAAEGRPRDNYSGIVIDLAEEAP